MIAQAGFPRLTPNTITDPDQYRECLREVRRRGYAVDIGEAREEICCVGAPIFDSSGAVVGAVSVSGPSFRLATSRVGSLAEQVQMAAAATSRSLGYMPEPDWPMPNLSGHTASGNAAAERPSPSARAGPGGRRKVQRGRVYRYKTIERRGHQRREE